MMRKRNEGNFKLCVSISGESLRALQAKLREAKRFDPDFVELRLDYIRNLDASKIDALKDALEGRNEILTIRSRSEGGRLSIPEKERVKLISYAIYHLKPFMIDIEISTLRSHPILLEEISERRSTTKLIASYHDLEGTKTKSFLARKMLSAPLQSKSLFAIKIVSRARTLQDNLKVLNLYSKFQSELLRTKIAGEKHPKLVAFCTGNVGVASRILSFYFGSPLGYVSLLGEPVAPGQMDIETMRNLLKLGNNNTDLLKPHGN